MNEPAWYVVTGGPCAGKTTLLAELASRGYRTVPEAARRYTEAELARGRTLEDIRRDEAAFQRALIPLKIAAEQSLPRDETVFLDRGMHDSIAYLIEAGVPPEAAVEEVMQRTAYRRAFLLDLLPFVKDRARIENAERAQILHDLLEKTYRDAGIRVVRVPVLPVAERADFILMHL